MSNEGRNLNPIIAAAPAPAVAETLSFGGAQGADRLWWSPPVFENAVLGTGSASAGFGAGGKAAEPSRSPGIDAADVFDMLRHVNDPEHPLTLEQLKVCQLDKIRVDDVRSRVHVHFTPTIPHCSMATLIGLSLKVKLLRSLPRRFKIDVAITPGTHASETAINKQLADKERVAAALENENLLGVVQKCIANTDPE